MAEELSAAQPETIDSGSVQANPGRLEDMDIVSVPNPEIGSGDEASVKRGREEEAQIQGVSKKYKIGDEKSAEEERREKKLEGGEKENGSGGVKLGPKEFVSSVEMFDYFYKFLHFWPTDLDINKYEHMILLDLIKKGHPEPDKKISGGIKAFQIRNHPMWKSRCFFLVREDETSDDFSFRKCVDHILPLPENMKINPGAKSGGGGHGRGGRGRGGRGRGRGRGGKSRN